MNQLSIIGNIVRDPEVKFLPSGVAVCELSIAYNEVWYNDAKEKQERTYFFGAVAWGKMGENIAKYFGKGQRIALTGSLTQETWEDKESGKKREKTKIKVTGFDFCGDKKQAEREPATASTGTVERSWAGDKKKDPLAPEVDDDNLPY